MSTYALGRSAGATRTTGALVLAGVTVATFTAAVQTFVQQRHTDVLQNVYSWLLGGFSTATWSDVAVCAPYIAASSLVLVLHRRVLDVLSLGDDEAASLGIDVSRARLAIVVAATLGTAAAVAVSGLIAFVGIIVPHTIRLLVSTSYRAVVPLSLVAGAGFLVLTDVLARTLLSPGGAADRRRHRLLRRAVLRRRPAHVADDRGDRDARPLGAVRPVAAVREPLARARSRARWTALIGPNGAGKTSRSARSPGSSRTTARYCSTDGRAPARPPSGRAARRLRPAEARDAAAS